MKSKLKDFLTGRFFIILFALFFLATMAVIPALGSPESGVSNLDSLWLLDTGPTAQPVLRANQRGAGMIIEALDNGTRVWGITGGGKVIEGGVNCFRSNTTVTDTLDITSTVTAISTPTWADCSLRTITGDAAHCAITQGSGVVTITVRNSNATPAANAAGAVVNYEICGTPQ